MRYAHAVPAVRAAEERAFGRLPEGTLMQRAATGLARRCAAMLGRTYGSRVVLLVGGGNNGADAMWAGSMLARRGARVEALLAGRADDEALAALVRAGGRVREAGGGSDGILVAGADIVVDGLVGIGGSGGLRPAAARLAALANESPAAVVAVDVPSGVDASTGRVPGEAVRADVTVTFGTLKTGLLVAPGSEQCGLVELVNIGLGEDLTAELTDGGSAPDVEVLDADDVAVRLRTPVGEATKYTRGVVGVVAGSERFTGAAVLSVGGALRAGAGMVRYAGAGPAADQVRARWPEAVVTVVEPGDVEATLGIGQVQAWVVGPGLGTDERAARTVAGVLGTGLPVIVDADALSVLARDPALVRGRRAPTLLTPHAGEFARLASCERAEVEADRLARVRALAADLGATVLLKGSTTLVADLSGLVRVNPTGTPWLAAAGSGDVLSGACGALLAQGLSPVDAGSCAAFLHGLAGSAALRGVGGSAAGDGSGGGVAPILAPDLLAFWPDAERVVRQDQGARADEVVPQRRGNGRRSRP